MPIAVGLAACWWAKRIGIGHLTAPIEISFILMCAMFFMNFVAVIAASSGAPLADPWLRYLDLQVFGFDRDLFISGIRTWPIVMKGFGWIYMSLGWTPPLLFVLLSFAGREDRAWALLNALLITLVVSVACLALTPAYGSPPYAYRFTEVLDGVRNALMRRFDSSVISGLVTFPSMHAAYGVVLARGSALIGWWGTPLLALNGAVVASALIVGGHYLVDIVAGCAVAWCAITVARLR